METSEVSVFVKVIQAGSFTGAALKLGAPKSTVSSKVSNLENRLGVTLIHRTTRKLRLTEEGETFFKSCAHALSEIESAEALIAGGQKTPQGRVSLTAPNDMGRFLASFLKRFLTGYPGVNVDLILTNRYVDLIGEGVDLAIRAGVLQDSSLVAKRVAISRMALFASPSYLASAGVPGHPKDLSNHQCLVYTKTRGDWELLKDRSRAKVKVQGFITSDDIAALKELAVQDLGIVLLPTFMCRDEVAIASLVPVLPGWASNSSPISIVYAAKKFQHPKIRVIVEELAKEMIENYGLADKICGAGGPE